MAKRKNHSKVDNPKKEKKWIVSWILAQIMIHFYVDFLRLDAELMNCRMINLLGTIDFFAPSRWRWFNPAAI